MSFINPPGLLGQHGGMATPSMRASSQFPPNQYFRQFPEMFYYGFGVGPRYYNTYTNPLSRVYTTDPYSSYTTPIANVSYRTTAPTA